MRRRAPTGRWAGATDRGPPIQPRTGGTTGTTTRTTRGKKVVKHCIVIKVSGKTIHEARSSLFAKGCKVEVTYKKSHKKPGTVLLTNRKVGEKLVVRALVEVRVRQEVLSTPV